MPTEATTTTGTGETTPKTGTETKPAETKPAETKPAEELGENGVEALRRERELRRQAERERDALTQERDSLKAKHQTAEEKALEEAEKRGRESATLDTNRRVVRSEIRAAAAGQVADPDDVAALLGDLDRFVVKGEVDTKAIKSAIDELVKAKPYLAAAGGKPRPLPGGSARQTTGTSFNDDLRRQIHRRR